VRVTEPSDHRGRASSYLRRVDGFYAKASSLGKPLWGGSTDTAIEANLWLFTDGLVVTPATPFRRFRPIRPLRSLAIDSSLEPDTISDAYSRAVRLERDRVLDIDYEGPHGLGRLATCDARFRLVSGAGFVLQARRSRAEELIRLLRETYPGIVSDKRKRAD
jgi:hypothetical protein